MTVSCVRLTGESQASYDCFRIRKDNIPHSDENNEIAVMKFPTRYFWKVIPYKVRLTDDEI